MGSGSSRKTPLASTDPWDITVHRAPQTMRHCGQRVIRRAVCMWLRCLRPPARRVRGHLHRRGGEGAAGGEPRAHGGYPHHAQPRGLHSGPHGALCELILPTRGRAHYRYRGAAHICASCSAQRTIRCRRRSPVPSCCTMCVAHCTKQLGEAWVKMYYLDRICVDQMELLKVSAPARELSVPVQTHVLSADQVATLLAQHDWCTTCIL